MIPEYVKLIGDGERAEGFEEWQADSLETMLKPEQLAAMEPAERAKMESRFRICKIISVATVESARQESQAGQSSPDLLVAMADAMAFSLASLLSLTIEKEGFDAARQTLAEHINDRMAEFLGIAGRR